MATQRPDRVDVNREQLAHVLCAAAQIAGDGEILVLGSQSILGSFDDESLPPAATMSVEVDIAFLSDPGAAKSDLVDDAIAELSSFHATFGYYGQGVEVFHRSASCRLGGSGRVAGA